ncbi:MAG: hypothetical protein K8J31_14050 [Anaerolineae bacterium]|nr:hypothetical protein [Anaerolineae bacterium]
MPISMIWQNEDRAVAYSQLVGHWNMKQFRQAWNRGRELMLEKPGEQVDFILDLRESILIPPDFVRQFRQLKFDPTQNLGQIVFVGADDHIQTLIGTILWTLTYHLDVSYADSPDEALALIDELRMERMVLSA